MNLRGGWSFGKFLTSKMKQHPLIVFLVLSLIALFLRFRQGVDGTLETQPAAVPRSIASLGSKVTDCWTGKLLVRDIVLAQAEIALVYYYAPWCAKSLDGFREFEAAAEALHAQVSFIGVNCWWIQGECRGALQFNKFPQVYLHHKNMKYSIFYNGPLKKDHFIDFLLKVMNPISYLGTRQEVEEHLSKNQLTVLGFFEFSTAELPTAFLNYSVLAVKHLETHNTPIHFGVVTNPAVAHCFYLEPGILQLRDKMQPHETVHLNLNSTVKKLRQRLKDINEKVAVPDLHFPGAKSNFIHQTLHKGPTLIIFLSSTNMKNRKNYLNKIEQLVLQYADCGEGFSSSSASAIYDKLSSPTNTCCRSTSIMRSKNLTDVALVCNVCIRSDFRYNPEDREPSWCADNEFLFSGSIEDLRWLGVAQQYLKQSLHSTICAELHPFYDVQRTRLNLCCASANVLIKELEEQGTQSFIEGICLEEIINRTSSTQNVTGRGMSEEEASLLFTESDGVRPSDSIIAGLACKTNRTLQFLTLDFDRHERLSQNLGVDRHVYQVHDVKMGAVIVDPANEIHHVISSSNFHIENFIVNYTLGTLPRTYHETAEVKACSPDVSFVCIHEVTSSSFGDIVLNNDKDVLLLYYVPWCLACTSVSHMFLSLAKLLSPTSSVLLARIDAYDNELPWQFAVQSYPTVILFPGNRSSYSVVYPQVATFTVAKLLRFLFENGNSASTKQILMNLCMAGRAKGEVHHEACRKWNVARNK